MVTSYENPFAEPSDWSDDGGGGTNSDDGLPPLFLRVPIPAFDDWKTEAGRCAALFGHELTLKPGKIVCRRCPAEWRLIEL